jgi:hypothetical protein
MMYLLSLSFTTHRRKAPVLPGPFAAPGRKWEFTKSSWAGHEIAAFVFYDAIVAQLQHVSPISPSPFTTHTGRTPWLTAGAFCCPDFSNKPWPFPPFYDIILSEIKEG